MVQPLSVKLEIGHHSRIPCTLTTIIGDNRKPAFAMKYVSVDNRKPAFAMKYVSVFVNTEK